MRWLAVAAAAPAFVLNDHASEPLSTIRNLSSTREVAHGLVEAYAGFVNVNATSDAHIFYWLVECPQPNRPLLVFLEGGPGASGSQFFFTAQGPLSVSKSGLAKNTNGGAWYEEFNVLTLDQPVGVGFSYAADGTKHYVTSDAQAGVQAAAAVELVATAYGHSKLFIMGESYGGKYAPYTAKALLDKKSALAVEGMVLSSGWTEPHTVVNSYASVFAKKGFLIGQHNEQAVAELASQLSQAVDEQNWTKAHDLHDVVLGKAGDLTGVGNWYALQAGELNSLEAYMESVSFACNYTASIQDQLPVGKGRFSPLNMGVNFDVYRALYDAFFQPGTQVVQALLDAGVRVLAVGGELDGMVPVDGTTKTFEQLCPPLAKAEQAIVAAQEPIAYRRTAPCGKGGTELTQAVVLGAGHMIYKDKPAQGRRILADFILQDRAVLV